MERLIAFRFDVDTHVCAREGVPRLIQLGTDTAAPFTFFYNMGRAAWRSGAFVKGPSQYSRRSPRIGAIERLGYWGCLQMLLCNPYVGAGEDRNLRVARDNGHEIGLHGGRNHGVWMRKARLWNRRQLTEEIDWGLNALRTAGVDSVTSFASPGWQGSDLLNEVLVEREFNVVSDTRAALCERVSVISQGRLRSVPVNLLSEPGGRGYLEGKYAQGAEFRTIVDEFRNDVRRFGRFVVVYGHPNFCGRVGLLAMRRLVEVALEEGFTPVTISELTRRVPSE